MPHVLNANVALNDCYETLIVWPWGLGAEQAEYHHTSKGVLKRGISRESTDERLTVVRLDDLVTAADIDTKVDLMKIDVEGMEVDVLKGGMATIERDRPVILTEEWKTETTQSIGKLIRRFGYSRTHAFGGKGKAPVGVWEAR
jgi:FkbM family methyltransferase